MPTVNVERILERADAALKRAEAPHLRRLRETTNAAYDRLAAEIRRRWPDVLEDVAGATPAYAEARARLLLEQLRPYMSALDYGSAATGVPDTVRAMIRLGAEHGVETAADTLNAYGTAGGFAGLAAASSVIDFRAVEATVRNFRQLEAIRAADLETLVSNARARLTDHSLTTIRKIENSVVSAVVRGQGPRRITREIREALRGEGRIPAGGLHYRAETIAQTELAKAKAEATRERYEEWNVDLVQWYATLDERTCPWCGHRHGMVYPRDELTIPAHPRCRCYASPFRPEFTEAGLVDVDEWKRQQAEIREKVPNLKTGLTPWERETLGKERYPAAAWTPSSGWTGAARR